MDQEKARKALLRGLVEQTKEMVGTSTSDGVFEAGLQRELAADFFQSSNVDLAREFARVCPIQGIEPEEYKNRLIEWAPGRLIFAGIRFDDLNPKRPFVQITASTHPILENISKIEAVCRFEFDSFTPSAIEFMAPGRSALRTKPVTLVPERYLLGATWKELRRLHPKSKLNSLIQLKPVVGKSFFPIYQDQYRRAMEQTSVPMVAGSLMLFEESIDLGHLFEATIDSRPVGYLALNRSDYRGVKGWDIIDQVVDPAFWGQGIAGLMQRSVLYALKSAAAKDFLYGGIHGMNRASLKTALNMGREVLGIEFRQPLKPQRKSRKNND